MKRWMLLCCVLGLALSQQPAHAHGVARQAPSPCVVAVTAAITTIGSPYVWGAKGPDAFDCSGLTSWAYLQAGITIGPSTYDQQSFGVSISCGLSDLQGASTTCWAPGDLIFLRYPGGQHVAIYAGDGLFVDAYNPETGVLLHDVAADPFYHQYYWQSRRPVSDCAGGSIELPSLPPSPLPVGSSPAIESIANILSPVSLPLPWSCASCAVGQSTIELLPYPDFGLDVLYPFKWLGVWIWNEVFRNLICWMLAITQALLNALALVVNSVIIAGINLLWSIAILLLLWLRDMFLSLWGVVGWMRIAVWDLFMQTMAIGDMVQRLWSTVAEVRRLATEVLGHLTQLIMNTGQSLGYIAGLFMSIVPGLLTGIANPQAPPQLAQAQSFFLFQWMIDIPRAIADSSLGWAWYGFVAVIYIHFIMWLLDEMSTLNQ